MGARFFQRREQKSSIRREVREERKFKRIQEKKEMGNIVGILRTVIKVVGIIINVFPPLYGIYKDVKAAIIDHKNK